MAGAGDVLRAMGQSLNTPDAGKEAGDLFAGILAAMAAPPALQKVIQKAAASLEEKDQIIATLRERIALQDEQIAGMVPKPNATGGQFFGWTSSRYAAQVIKDSDHERAQVLIEEIAEKAWKAGHDKGTGMGITPDIQPIKDEISPYEVAMFALGSIRAVERMVTVEGKALSNDAKAKLFQTLDAVQNLIHNPKVMGDLPIEPHGNRTGLDPASDKGAAPCR